MTAKTRRVAKSFDLPLDLVEALEKDAQDQGISVTAQLIAMLERCYRPGGHKEKRQSSSA